jgi:probable rRNA maturation factor
VNSEPDRDTVCIDAGGLALEIDVAPSVGASQASLAQLVAKALSAADEVAGPVRGAVTVIVDGDERIRALNKLWRGLDKPTNVLSFSYPDIQPGPESYIGDIAISHETAAREAAAEHKPFSDHIAHLAVHGFLHLLGYDHESGRDAEQMERLERVILARIGISDPYVAREGEG